MKTFVLNIGWARAGSTALRRNFLMRHPDLVVASGDQSALDGPAAATLSFLKTAPDEIFWEALPIVQEGWRDYVAGSEKLVCLSDEELSIGLPGQADPVTLARRSAALFPEARVLAVVRTHLEAVASFYGLTQRPSFGQQRPFDEWLDAHLLGRGGADIRPLFAYSDTLTGYRDGRAAGALMVANHRDLLERPLHTYQAMAEWMGISPGVCAILPSDELNASPGGRPDWPDERRQAVEALYQVDRRRLHDEFGLTL